MIALAGPLHLLALVLVVSGLQKLVAPAPAATAMAEAGLPVPFRGRPASGVLLGAVETGIGITAIALPAWWAAALLGAFYLALAGFVVRLRATNTTAGCGCFGASSTPPGRVHVVINTASAAVAFAVAIAGVPDIVDVFDAGIGVAVPYLVLLAIGAGLLLVAPTLVAEIEQVRRGDLPRAFTTVTSRSTP